MDLWESHIKYKGTQTKNKRTEAHADTKQEKADIRESRFHSKDCSQG